MGSSSSKPTEVVKEVVKYVESDESKRRRLLNKLENQLKELKQEVTTIQPAINNNVRHTVSQKQAAFLMRYSQLTDKEQVIRDIQSVFGGSPLTGFLVETASKLIITMASSEYLKEILGWQERTMVKRVGENVFGMEIHFKVKILEESKLKGTVSGFRSKDTVVLIAYKCCAHVMDLDPKQFPDDEELKKLTL